MENERKVDPGWNDPPMLNYNSSNPPPKSRIMNKRVAFPLSGQSNSPLNPNCPPSSSAPPGIPPVADDKTTDVASEPPIESSEDFFKTTTDHLDKLLVNVDTEDVRKRIELMKSMWQDGKFSVNVQKLICELITSISDKNLPKANELQLKLMMEPTAVCGTWMTAIRHLINSLQ